MTLQTFLNLLEPWIQIIFVFFIYPNKLYYRFARERDTYEGSNLDWMASLWVKERIEVNNMVHVQGHTTKEAAELSIQDFVPSQPEMDYVFLGLIHYYSSRLVSRHPEIFKSINSSIELNHPHQFEDAMSKRSEEFTGKLFTKSETKTEDLNAMMSEVQDEYVHKYRDMAGNMQCYEKRVLSGDQKTEKNSYYGILR